MKTTMIAAATTTAAAAATTTNNNNNNSCSTTITASSSTMKAMDIFLSVDVKYNHEKEEKIKQEKKQQELVAIEEAIKYAEESKKKSKS